MTSCSFRAFRFAKRCPGSRGGLPLLGWSLRRFPPIPRSRGRGRFAARRLAWVINWAFRRARRLGVPFPSSFVGRPKPPSIVKRTDSHVGPLGLLAMTTVFCHSEASAHTGRGNPSFLRWTGVRAAVPRAWPPPTKFRAEIWGVGQVVGPYGKPDQPPKPAGAQRSARARGREGWAGIGARTIPKRGPPPRPPRQRLAKRKARKEQLVKFSLCPIPSECSTAY